MGLFVLSIITYVDRACISSAKEPIALDIMLSDSAMGLVFGAFALGYALAQIPSGWFADRFGPRVALTAVVSAWSILTALTGAAWSFTSLVVIRFLFGIAEAGAFPAGARAIYNWLPAGERGRANGIVFSGSRLGAALAFPLLAWMLERWAWRISFAILGLIGLAWAVVWVTWFRDCPRQSVVREDAFPAKELRLGQVLRTRGMALAMGQYFASNFTFFICLSWMFPYLRTHYRLSHSEAAAYAMVPLVLAASAQWVAGFSVDLLYRSHLRDWSRRLPAIAGFFLAAVGILAVTFTERPAAAVAWFALATFGADMTISPSWAYCIDMGGKRSGAVSASMNMLGNFGSFFSASAFPLLQRLTGGSDTYFQTAALLNVLGILCWLKMGPGSSRVGARP